MDPAIIQTSVTLFEILCVIIVFASLLLQSRFFRDITGPRPLWTTQVVLMLFFGVMSIFGTLSGISIYGAVANVRDLGPMAAGLICGPYVGLGSGIIGGLFRFAQGGPYLWTGLSAPILSGLLGGILFLANQRRFVPAWIAVLYIGLSETLISCYTLVLVTKPAEFFTVVTTVAIPMIVFNVIGMVIFASFVHHFLRQKDAREALEIMERELESKRNLAAIINTIPNPVYVLGPDRRFTMVNESLCRFLGQPREEILGKNPGDFLRVENPAPGDVPAADPLFASPPGEREVTAVLPGGERFRLIATSTPYADAAKNEFVVGVLFDITEKMRMADDLARSESWYRTLFEHTGTATIIIDEDFTIAQVNSEFVQLTGYPHPEIVGKMSWEQLTHPGDLAMVGRYHHDRLANPASAPATYQVRIRCRDGTVKTLHAVVAVIPGTKKTIASYIDITGQIRNVEALQLVNRKLNLLSSITRHDIINQILILKGFLALLSRKTGDNEIVGYAGRAEQAARNIERQIIFTRDYQDMGVNAPAWQNLKTTVIEAKGALPTRNVQVVTVPPDLEIYSDPLLVKVFYNLIDNSLQYGGEGMKNIRIVPEESPDGLVITYEDDGEGIAEADLSRLFEQGFGKHTGFGLFLSREILSITGISIEAAGNRPGGAKFLIRVPRDAWRLSGGNGAAG